MERYSIHFAQAYGAGTYSACTYSDATTCTTAGGGAIPGTSGGLVNTGFTVLIIATIACLLIFGAILVRFWRRPKMASEPVRTEDQDISQRYR